MPKAVTTMTETVDMIVEDARRIAERQERGAVGSVGDGPRLNPPPETTVHLDTPPTRQLTSTLARDIVPTRPEWRWRPWLVRGAVHLLVGRQGSGKTTYAAWLLAQLTTGTSVLGASVDGPLRVAILSLEEPADRIVARLLVNGADIDLVEILGEVSDLDDDGAPYRRPWRLPSDCSLLEERILASGLDVVVVDGLGYAVNGDSHNYGVIGSALSGLAGVAERTGVSLIGITHPPKGTSSPVTAAIGSTAWTAIPRIVWVLGTDPEDESRRAVRVAKSAFEAPESGIAFSITNDELYETGLVTNITTTDVSAEDLTTAAATQEERGERAEARQFLSEILADGPVESGEVAAAARAAGISERTLKRARGDLGVVSERERSGGTGRTAKWTLRLPVTRGPSPEGQPRPQDIGTVVSTRTFTTGTVGTLVPGGQRAKGGPLVGPLGTEAAR